MATDRPFDYGKRNYMDMLNDLYNMGMPRVRVDPDDPESAPTDVIVARQMQMGDNGCVADVRAAVAITFAPECVADGFSVFINVVTGTATIHANAYSGTTFQDGVVTKTLNAGQAALISSDGTNFRIFRFTAT